MPSLDLADETYLAVPPVTVARVVADPERWRAWWPDVELTVHQDRGPAGIRWVVAGAVQGSAEIWLEPLRGGTLLHYYLRAEPVRPLSPRRIVRERERRARAWKQHAFALKDALEAAAAPERPEGSSGATEVPTSTG